MCLSSITKPPSNVGLIGVGGGKEGGEEEVGEDEEKEGWEKGERIKG